MSATIPAPAAPGKLWSSASFTLYAITVGDLEVVYFTDQLEVILSVQEKVRYGLSSGELSRVSMLAGYGKRPVEPIGRVVVTASIDCGGTLADWNGYAANGSPRELDAVRVAIEHFYAEEREPQARKVFRAIYLRLTRTIERFNETREVTG